MSEIQVNNDMLRSKVIDYENDITSLKSTQTQLENKVGELQQLHVRDSKLIQRQEFEISQLQKRWSNTTSSISGDGEYQELQQKFNKILAVKLKYEQIIKAMVDKPELKPYIAQVLDQM